MSEQGKRGLVDGERVNEHGKDNPNKRFPLLSPRPLALYSCTRS